MELQVILAIAMLLCTGAAVLIGFPVGFTLAGVALVFAGIGFALGLDGLIANLPGRIFGSAMTNDTLIAVPLFVYMGVMLERSRVAEDLLETMGRMMGGISGGLGLAVVLVGALLAASTGIVGATVVTMGLISLPVMLRSGYSATLATGTICASGTLGQIIPPSIVLVILGDQISAANQEAQSVLQQAAWASGNTDFSPTAVSVGDLFAGALLPGFLLVALYCAYLIVLGRVRPGAMPAVSSETNVSGREFLSAVLPPLLLVLAVLGSILSGVAPPGEAAAVGAAGATLLAARGRGRSSSSETGFPVVTSLLIGFLAGAILGAAMTVGSEYFLYAPLFSGVACAIGSICFLKTGLWTAIFRRLDTKKDGILYLTGLALGGLFFLSATVDLRLTRSEIPAVELPWILLAVLLFLCVVRGVLVAFARVWHAGILVAVNQKTLEITAMIFTILIGAALFSLVFRGLGGDEVIASLLKDLPGGSFTALLAVMLVMFVLGFFLDFIEIALIVVPIVAPVLLATGEISPVWLGVLMAMNLQTSFLTPPFGFALFYLRGVAPDSVVTSDLYRGIIPFVVLQLLAIGIVWAFPGMSEWLPRVIFG